MSGSELSERFISILVAGAGVVIFIWYMWKWLMMAMLLCVFGARYSMIARINFQIDMPLYECTHFIRLYKINFNDAALHFPHSIGIFYSFMGVTYTLFN